MTQEESWLLKEKYNDTIVDGFIDDCARLKGGEPLAYIIGHIPFLNTTIHLDSHPLIPRTETEFWTKQVIDEISARGLASGRMLDLCAGSGCIGTAILKALPHITVDFVEIEESHHPTIQKNILQNGIDIQRVRIMGGNLFEHVSDTYDYILTNPPYIDKDLGRTDPEVILHEPEKALFGGQNGVEIIQAILESAHRFLTREGVLYIEHEPEQQDTIHQFGKTHFPHIEIRNDQYGIPRFTRFARTA
jgi:release factor glutamine methyltransferase